MDPIDPARIITVSITAQGATVSALVTAFADKIAAFCDVADAEITIDDNPPVSRKVTEDAQAVYEGTRRYVITLPAA